MKNNQRFFAGAALAALMVVVSQAEAEASVRRENERPPKGKQGARAKVKKRVRARTAVRRSVRRVSRLRERASQYEPLIAAAAVKYGVDPYAVWAVAYSETRFRWWLVSPVGAQGPMQLMPGTAAQYGVKNPFDVAEAIDAAARYVRKAQVQFGGRLDLVWASYNAGFGAVEAYSKGVTIKVKGGKTINPKGIKTGGVPPYAETRGYVARCWRVYNAARAAGLFPAEVTAKSGLGVLPPVESARQLLDAFPLYDPELSYLGGAGGPALAPARNNDAVAQAAEPRVGDVKAVEAARQATPGANEEVFFDVHSGARYVVRGGEIVRPLDAELVDSPVTPESSADKRPAVAARSVYYGAGGGE